MIATASESTPAESSAHKTSGERWMLAGSFDTIESAETYLQRLRAEGIEACLSLVGGLSVIARYGESGSYRSSTTAANSSRKA